MALIHSPLGPLEPLSLSDALRACEGTAGQDNLDDKPLRVLVPRESDGSYELVQYTGQPYVAISYCWPSGDSFKRLNTSNDPSIVHTPSGPIDSQHFSQFIARVARTFGGNKAIWIDYHCINQTDPVEKMGQIAIFQRIYARAETAFVMLEDIALTPHEYSVLIGYKATEQSVSLVRHVISARWFARAWCSQELVLSRRANFFVHDASDPGAALRLDSDGLWHSMDAARNVDGSIPLFSSPRGNVPDYAVFKNTAWALSLVRDLGCSDEYDKISLICNLVRYIYRFTSRLSAFGAPEVSVPTIRLNVLKMSNIMAIARHDFSLLLANHGLDNPLQRVPGFGWAGAPVSRDVVSERWAKKDYEVDRDPDVAIDRTALVIRGVLAEIVREHAWEIVHDPSGLHVTVDGTPRTVALDFQTHKTWTWHHDRPLLRDLIVALADSASQFSLDVGLHARTVLAYVFAEPDYQMQPEPISGDLVPLVREILGETIGQLKDMAQALKFLRRADGRMSFSTALLSEGSVVLVSGNAPAGDLRGQLLFLPFVARPKLFSPPMVMTANSMVLDSVVRSNGAYQCVGCVRGLGMATVVSPDMEKQLRIV